MTLPVEQVGPLLGRELLSCVWDWLGGVRLAIVRIASLESSDTEWEHGRLVCLPQKLFGGLAAKIALLIPHETVK